MGRPSKPTKDLTNKRFGYWQVIKWAGQHRWVCQCRCGAIHKVLSWNLRSGHTTRCNKCRQKSIWKHGHSKNPRAGIPVTPTYSSWLAMKKRCSKKSPAKKWYFDKGITICSRWGRFENFLADMGERPKGKTLERKNGRNGYSKSNCIWADILTQANNRSNNRRVRIGRETKTLAEWCRVFRINRSCVYQRITQGLPIKSALLMN